MGKEKYNMFFKERIIDSSKSTDDTIRRIKLPLFRYKAELKSKTPQKCQHYATMLTFIRSCT